MSNSRFPRSPLAGARGWLIAAVIASGLVAVANSPAEAAGRGARGSSARMAQGSVAGANRDQANRRGNVNVGNDVNIDIDVDHDHDWNGRRHPVAAGVVIGRMAVTTAAVVGARYYALPAGCTTVYRNGIAYYYCGAVYYQRTWYGNDVVYVVVNP